MYLIETYREAEIKTIKENKEDTGKEEQQNSITKNKEIRGKKLQIKRQVFGGVCFFQQNKGVKVGLK